MNDNNEYKRNPTLVFSYHEKNHELTMAEASLNQTAPIQRNYTIEKNIFSVGKTAGNDVIVHDDYVSNFHFKIEFRQGRFFLKDLQSTNGTILNGQKTLEAELSHGSTIQIGKAKFNFECQQKSKSLEPLKSDKVFHGMISKDNSMRRIFSLIESLETSLSPVFIQGETRTGKELIARAIHETSFRKSGRFVTVNCGAIPKDLIESELFGHEKGAFTGASAQREGLFEQAHMGTIFLDEIGELPLELQPKLLRVLETGEIRRVGSSKNIQVDVRIITATHRSLVDEIQQQRFREDLFYRIFVLPIVLPPLRDRKEDVPLLIDHFLKSKKNFQNNLEIKISKEAVDKMCAHRWPGNIRELKNVTDRAIALSYGEKEIQPQHIQFAIPTAASAEAAPIQAQTLEDMEKIMIVKSLQENGWSKKDAAEKLGISRSTLHEKIKKYGITEEPTD